MKEDTETRGQGDKGIRKRTIVRRTDLEVYEMAFETAMKVFGVSKTFPAEERYSLTDQIRRSSRSVCANLAEAWRKRRYAAAFVSKLSDAESEAAETQVWLQFAVKGTYLAPLATKPLYTAYDSIIGMLITMINNPSRWIIQ